MISDWKQELVKRAGELFARGNRAPAVGDAQKVIDDLHRKIGQLQDAHWNAERQAVEFGIIIGEYQAWSGYRGACSNASCRSGRHPSGASKHTTYSGHALRASLSATCDVAN